MKAIKLDKLNFIIPSKTTLPLIVLTILIFVNSPSVTLGNLDTESTPIPNQETQDFTFENIAIIQQINQTTGLIDNITINVEVDIIVSRFTLTLTFDVNINNEWGFNQIEVFNNMDSGSPILGIRNLEYEIEGWKLYNSYQKGSMNITVSQTVTDNSISTITNFDYEDFERPPIIPVLGSEMIIPYIDGEALYNTGFGTTNSSLQNCECVDLIEIKYEIEVLIPGNISSWGIIETHYSAGYFMTPFRMNNIYYSTGHHNLSYIFDLTQIYGYRGIDSLQGHIQLSARWQPVNDNVISQWSLYSLPYPDLNLEFDPREISRLAFQLFESESGIEYLDTNDSTTVDTIKLTVLVNVAEDIDVALFGFFVQQITYTTGQKSTYPITFNTFEFGYHNFTQGENLFSVNFPVDLLWLSDIEGWGNGSRPVFVQLQAYWSQDIEHNSEVKTAHYSVGTQLNEVEIRNFSDLTPVQSKTSIPNTTENEKKTETLDAGLLSFSPIWLTLIIICRKKFKTT